MRHGSKDGPVEVERVCEGSSGDRMPHTRLPSSVMSSSWCPFSSLETRNGNSPWRYGLDISQGETLVLYLRSRARTCISAATHNRSTDAHPCPGAQPHSAGLLSSEMSKPYLHGSSECGTWGARPHSLGVKRRKARLLHLILLQITYLVRVHHVVVVHRCP